MFTGIVKKLCAVSSVQFNGGAIRYQISFPKFLLEKLVIGASVSVDGVCQTVVAINGSEVAFDAIGETLERTTLKYLQAKSLVNIERALQAGDEIGGHFLSGHVMDTAKIIDKSISSTETMIRIGLDCRWMKYLLEKGFIAVDGVSLTIGEVDPAGSFKLYLIPETLKVTTLGAKVSGDLVNIEIDSQTQAIVDTVERIQKKHS